MALPISVLDTSPLPADGSGAQAIQNTLELAPFVEELGYTRFWVAEHHNMRGLAGVAPELLIAVIAQRTTRIRVGSGGILLPNYAPLKVAELFRVLEALTPGRIDAGIGRAPNQDQRTALALRQDEAALGKADDIALLVAQLEGFAQVAPSAYPADHPFHEVIASPEQVTFPPIFLLGSGQLSARIAAERGRGYAAAYFFSPEESEQAIRTYKTTFQPSAHFSEPHAILTVGVVCADTYEEAEAITRASQLTALRRLNGITSGFATLEEAQAYEFSPEDEEKLRRFAPIYGTPEQVQAQLDELIVQIGPDELMIATNVGDHAVRRHSFELLAKQLNLLENDQAAWAEQAV